MRTKLRYLLVVIVGLLISYTVPCAAQVNFVPELILSGEYTDNLFLDYDDTLKIDDTITTAGLNLNLEIIGQTTGLALTLNPSYSTFADNDTFDFWRYYVNLRTWNEFSRSTRLELNSTYLETENPRDRSNETLDDEVGEPAIEVDLTRRGRNRYRRSTNNIRLEHQFGKLSNYYMAVGYNILRDIDLPIGEEHDDYDEILPAIGLEYWVDRRWGIIFNSYMSDRDYVERNDRKEYLGSLRILKSLSRHLLLYLQYRHTYLDFDNEALDENYQVYAPSLGVEYQFGKNTFIRVGAGYYLQDFDTSEKNDGAFLDAEISQDWIFSSGFIRLIASSGHDIEDTGSEDLGLQIFYEGRLEAGYDFTSRLKWEYLASYRIDDYPNDSSERNDKTLIAGTGLSYQIMKWMSLALTYEIENVDSNIETGEFTENSVLLKITMAPSNPLRLN